MSPSENMIHVRLDPANMKAAKRRAKAVFRENVTAYINYLIAADDLANPPKAKRVSGLKHPTKAAKKR